MNLRHIDWGLVAAIALFALFFFAIGMLVAHALDASPATDAPPAWQPYGLKGWFPHV